MQIVIEIDEKLYNDFVMQATALGESLYNESPSGKAKYAIANGTPLPKGEWLDTETSYADGVRQYCRCSVCGKQSVRPLGDFCRWCGARMVEPQENNNVNCKTTKCKNCTNHNYCDFEPHESEE